ncbi:sugar kinase [Allosalinactinospora lopnorensis]|uniref:sugar kinase n=1 Tax=Allosalinactinospora lopnorensis TaxID=1352348 RepID=UPI000A4E79DD|nr:sugar kinase [Allosalinactinospora lopnorensis]
MMIKSHATTGTTAVSYYRAGSAASALDPADIPAGMIENAELLHLTGITPLLSSSARRTVLHTIQRARTAGTIVSFDVNHRTALATSADAAPVFAEIAARSDIVFGGEAELALVVEGLGSSPDVVAPSSAEDLLRALAEAGVSEGVCKRGEHGALALIERALASSPAHRVPVLDTVGAGDAFVAGYLSARLDGLDVQARLDRANACGAHACMSPGDWEGAPRLRDIAALSEPEADPVRR